MNTYVIYSLNRTKNYYISNNSLNHRECNANLLSNKIVKYQETKEYNCGHNIPCDDLLFLSLRFLLIQTNTIPT